MTNYSEPPKDPEINHFIKAHEISYSIARSEVKNGRKISHWMWYIFPQVYGLGCSDTAEYYAIYSLRQAYAFLWDPCLGGHLKELCDILLSLPTNDPVEIFGFVDSMKLQSCMTLFGNLTSPGTDLFKEVLEKYFEGEECPFTLKTLENWRKI